MPFIEKVEIDNSQNMKMAHNRVDVNIFKILFIIVHFSMPLKYTLTHRETKVDVQFHFEAQNHHIFFFFFLFQLRHLCNVHARAQPSIP